MIKPLFLSMALLNKKQRALFLLFTAARALINLLDVAGLVAIGLLGAMLASGLAEEKEATFLGFTVNLDSSKSFLWVFLIIVAFFLVKSISATVLLRLTSIFLARVEAQIAEEAASYIFSADLSALRPYSRGDIQFGLTLSVQHATTGMLLSGAAIVTEGALFFFVLTVFALVDFSTALVVAGYFLALVFGFQFLVNRRLKRLGTRLWQSSVGVTNSLQDLLSSFREIHVSERKGFFLGRFNNFRSRYARDSALQRFLEGLPRFFVEAGLMVGVLVIVGWQFLRDDLASGVVTTAIFLTGGVRMMAALLPMQNAVANIRTNSSQAAAAIDLVGRSREPLPFDAVGMGEADQQTNGSTSESGGLDVRASNLTFSYPGSDVQVVEALDMKITGGAFAALIGPSGSGKTTLADLLSGAQLPSVGEVLIGGCTPRNLRESKPGAVSYVPQTPGTVSGSIAENIALGIPKDFIDEDRVFECLEKAQLLDFVRSLPEGIQSDLGKQSDNLSGGQKQRLGLARALYTDPKFLILDEATSALDAETEASISRLIGDLRGNTTVLVIAHRLSTIQSADIVFVLENGELTAQGTFRQVREAVPMIENYVRLMAID